MDDDSAIVRKVLKGDRNAFSALVDKYQRQIFNFIYRFFGNSDLAFELSQDTLLKCFQSLKSYDQDRKFSTWLYTIAKNICIDEYKRRKAAGTYYLEDYPPSVRQSRSTSLPNPQVHCIMKEDETRLMNAIQILEPDKKAALILHYFQGLSYKEIAETLDVPLSTVKIRIFRAKKSLLEMLED
jgi:RNA polymerase sigma-70 factor (ECF subfamily)